MSRYMRQLLALVWKDLIVELRTRERIAAMGAFTVLVGVLFNYGLDRSIIRPQDVASGWIWMTIIFTGLLGLGRTFELERTEGAMRGVLMSPIPRDAIYLAKVAANFVLTMTTAVIVFMVFGLFFSLGFGSHPFLLLAVVGLGTLGFTALGTLFSAVTAGTTMGETLLPILIFPLLVPMVIYGVTATSGLFAGLPAGEVSGNLRMLAAFALVALAAGAGLFRFIVEE
jgi:heme exporter protein B